MEASACAVGGGRVCTCLNTTVSVQLVPPLLKLFRLPFCFCVHVGFESIVVRLERKVLLYLLFNLFFLLTISEFRTGNSYPFSAKKSIKSLSIQAPSNKRIVSASSLAFFISSKES